MCLHRMGDQYSRIKIIKLYMRVGERFSKRAASRRDENYNIFAVFIASFLNYECVNRIVSDLIRLLHLFLSILRNRN